MPATKTTIRGVLFRDWQIRALPNGMSQFRIPFRSQPEDGVIHGPEVYEPVVIRRDGEEMLGKPMLGVYDDSGEWGIKSPYQPGEVLFIKETWGIHRFYDADYDAGVHIGPGWIHYRADGASPPVDRWRPPQHCREIHARPERIKITSVGLGRRQEISEDDAEACGITSDFPAFECDTYSEGYAALWDDQHGKRNGWEKNGWDFAFDFKQLPLQPERT